MYADVNNQLHGTGTVVSTGIVTDSPLTFSSGGTATNQTFTGWGGGNVTGMVNFNSSAVVGVGNTGNGVLTINNGTTLQGANGTLGYGAGSTGTANVSNGTWDMATGSADLAVGSSGTGVLNLNSGGMVTNVNGTVSNVSSANVSGTGQWLNTGSLTTNGALNVAGGGYGSGRRGPN